VRRAAEQGFTLVELLISLALLGIVLTAVVSINIGTSQSAAALQVRNDLTPELQIAQSYMVGKLGQAAYVFPTGTIQLSANGKTTLSPSGSQNWRIGTDPIVAFVLPPKIVTPGGCASNALTNPSTYCYAFYAFYAMKRSDYVGTSTTTGITGADNPGKNPANDATAWVLMEYRSYYSNTANSVNTGFSVATTNIVTGNQGRLLMDYLIPYGASPATQLFSQAGAPVGIANQQAGVTTVTMNLAASQLVGSQTVRVPTSSATAFTSVTVYPRNVGKPMLDN